ILTDDLRGSDPKLNEFRIDFYLPACRGDYYLHLTPPPNPNLQPEPKSRATVYRLSEPGKALAVIESLEVGLARPQGDAFDKGLNERMVHRDAGDFDKRLQLIPDAGVLLALPYSNDRVVIYRLALKQ